jgi:hypothetical protein
MYSGKIAVPPGGGGLENNTNNRITVSNHQRSETKEYLPKSCIVKLLLKVWNRIE